MTTKLLQRGDRRDAESAEKTKSYWFLHFSASSASLRLCALCVKSG